ncbi:UBX domain-containing protein 3 [Spathaspora sp. JA1]|nr:UBX domain-containing protein 3 [Spathaspora sp. JA1]
MSTGRDTVSRSWLGRILQLSPQQQDYEALPNDTTTTSSSTPTTATSGNPRPTTMPGSFPESDTTTLLTPGPPSRINKFTLWINLLIIQPLIFAVRIIFRIISKIYNLLFTYTSPTIDPIAKVNKFVRDLEDDMTPGEPPETLPPFFQGSYTQALYMATQRGKFLFVYLTNGNNESSSQVFRSIIINPKFVRLFSDEVIIWGGDLTNPEAYQLANSLNVTRFPFLGLLCLTRSTTMSPSGPVKTPVKISLVARVQGGIRTGCNIDELIQSKFINKLDKYSGELQQIRMELQEKFLNQVLIKQQELNYQMSLEKDRLKKLEKEHEKLTKLYLAYHAPKYHELGVAREDCAKIAIKLVDGARNVVYFPRDMNVDDIFMYVELLTRGYLQDREITSTLSQQEAATKFKDFTMHYKFKLSSPLPPRTSLNDMRDCKIQDVNIIYPSGLLIVEEM